MLLALSQGSDTPCGAQMAHKLFAHLLGIFTASANETLYEADDVVFHVTQ